MPAELPSLKEVFLAALGVAPTEREAWLEQACGRDAEFRRRVDLMLAAHEMPQSLLDRMAPVADPFEAATGAFAGAETERPGTIIGPYKLLQQIGEGGMGVVYMAEQTLPIRRWVALKVIKPGMDTKQVVARFEAERQALALMDHPNIARVLDAGATETGRPFFVMELVHGIPITDYCDQANLPVAERLNLFVQVCQAVQHAHQKGVIHRDLKPSNVLVTLHDGTPVPKVIDFGVAKATGRSLTDKTLYTGLTQLVGTPLYMSPEQAELSGLDVDTRSDVYSLGVLLYELLTGTTPFGEETLRTAASFDEVRRIICEGEPPPPSTRLGALGDALTDISARRGCDPRRLGKLVRGELDWIIMKALEKDRDRRYETANALAADVRNYLSDESVQACPPSASHRLRRFARRHRAALVTSTLVASALLLGTTAATYFALRATEGERLARQKAAEAQVQAQRADQEAQRARDEKLLSDHRWYVAEMNLAQQAWQEDRMDAAQQHLQALEAKRPENPDLRGFDWYYLQRLGQWQDLRTLRCAGTVTGVTYSPDGCTIATGSGEGLVRLWEAASRHVVQALRGHEGGAINTLAFSPDGHRLASAGTDRTVRLWDVATGQELRKLGHTSAVSGVAFSPDGRTLATAGGDQTVRLWDAATGHEVHILRGHAGVVWSVAFSPDGRTLASGSRDQTVKLWDAATGREIRTLSGHANGLRSVAFSPDGRTIASASWDQTVKLWDADTGREVRTLRGHTGPLTGVAFSPDGERVASSAWDGTMRLWDVATGALHRTLRGHARIQVNAVAFSPDGRTVACAGYDGTVRLWDTMPGQEVLTSRGHVGGVCLAVFSPDGRRIASSSLDRTVRLWDADTGQEVRTLRGHTGPVYLVAFSPDGRTLASTSGDRTVRIWDATSGREVRTLRGHTALIRGVAFSPDGRTLASGSDDQTVKLWEADTGKPLRTLSGHTGAVLGVTFSPDGHRLATGSDDQTVKLRDLVAGQEVLTLRGHTAAVNGVTFSPDGRTLASASGDQTIKIWDARPLTPELRVLREARGVVEFLFDKPPFAAKVPARIHNDPSLSAEVRSRALELAESYRQSLVTQEAERVVNELYNRAMLRPEVLESLRTDASLSESVRQRALALAERIPESPVSLHGASWNTVCLPGAEPAAYRRALRQAEVARRLMPNDGYYLTALGMAQFRVGQYREAVATLMQAAQLQADLPCGRDPANLAFLALSQHHLGQKHEARATLNRLREALSSREQAWNQQGQDFLREAEALELDMAFPPDPFAH